jgi:hypothetical protein
VVVLALSSLLLLLLKKKLVLCLKVDTSLANLTEFIESNNKCSDPFLLFFVVKFHQRDSLFVGEVMLWLDDRGKGIGNERCILAGCPERFFKNPFPSFIFQRSNTYMVIISLSRMKKLY